MALRLQRGGVASAREAEPAASAASDDLRNARSCPCVPASAPSNWWVRNLLRALCSAPCACLSRASYQLVPAAASPSPPTAALSPRSRVPPLSLADGDGEGDGEGDGGASGDGSGAGGGGGGGGGEGRENAREIVSGGGGANTRARFDHEASAQAAQGEAEKQAERGAEFVVPGSELQRAIAMSLGAPAHAAEVRDAGAEAGESDPRCTQSRSPSSSPSPHECVICMEEFDSSNPEINTLCKCGVNRAHWHLMCLMQWLEKDTNCPICREPIFYEEKE